MTRVLLVTSRGGQELSRSDELYAEALAARSVAVEVAGWDAELTRFVGPDAVVLRSNWDYHDHLSEFRSWLNVLDLVQTAVWNPPDLVHWNLDKRYLHDLARWGIAVPRTALVAHATPEALASMLDAHGWERAVVKPAWGASGAGVQLVERARLRRGTPSMAGILDGRPALLQEYLPEIEQGEVSLVYFDGELSHAVLKRPQPGEFRVNSQYGGEVARLDVAPSVDAAGRSVLAALPALPLYARIDGVLRDGEFVLVEVEVNEPGLWLHLVPGSAERFADATLARIDEARRRRGLTRTGR